MAYNKLFCGVVIFLLTTTVKNNCAEQKYTPASLYNAVVNGTLDDVKKNFTGGVTAEQATKTNTLYAAAEHKKTYHIKYLISKGVNAPGSVMAGTKRRICADFVGDYLRGINELKLADAQYMYALKETNKLIEELTKKAKKSEMNADKEASEALWEEVKLLKKQLRNIETKVGGIRIAIMNGGTPNSQTGTKAKDWFTELNNLSGNDNAKAIEEGINRGELNINQGFGLFKLTPLHIAVSKNATNTTRMLLKKGADINRKNALGFTALTYSIKNNSLELTQLLIENGAITNFTDAQGNTPLGIAEKEGYTKLVALLKQKGASSLPDVFTGFDEKLTIRWTNINKKIYEIKKAVYENSLKAKSETSLTNTQKLINQENFLKKINQAIISLATVRKHLKNHLQLKEKYTQCVNGMNASLDILQSPNPDQNKFNTEYAKNIKLLIEMIKIIQK